MIRANKMRMIGLALLTAAAVMPSIAQAGDREICKLEATSFEIWFYQLVAC